MTADKASVTRIFYALETFCENLGMSIYGIQYMSLQEVNGSHGTIVCVCGSCAFIVVVIVVIIYCCCYCYYLLLLLLLLFIVVVIVIIYCCCYCCYYLLLLLLLLFTGEELIPYLPGLMEKLFQLLMGDYVNRGEG